MKNLSIVAILCGVLLGGDGGSAKSYGQAPGSKSDVSSLEDLKVKSAADILVQCLGATSAEVRDNAATALEAMGPKAAEALADYIVTRVGTRGTIAGGSVLGITEAVTIVGKIGNKIADDEKLNEGVSKKVTDALLLVARPSVQSSGKRQSKSSMGGSESDWMRLQMRLAAIEALGKINEYRGGILEKKGNGKMSVPGIDECNSLEKIAEDLFENLAVGRQKTPPPPPPLVPTDEMVSAQQKADATFYKSFFVLYRAQRNLIDIAAQVNEATALSKPKDAEGTKESPLSNFRDAKTFAKALETIESAYLEATKISGAQKPADAAEDKSPWQLRTEAAYKTLIEVSQLNNQLKALQKAFLPLAGNRDELVALISELGNISQEAFEEAQREPKPVAGEPSNPDRVVAEVAKAVNRIFSKRPEKPTADTDKKEIAKKDTKDTSKEDSGKKP